MIVYERIWSFSTSATGWSCVLTNFLDSASHRLLIICVWNVHSIEPTTICRVPSRWKLNWRAFERCFSAMNLTTGPVKCKVLPLICLAWSNIFGVNEVNMNDMYEDWCVSHQNEWVFWVGALSRAVAMLTHKIANMTEHLKEHHKDNHSRRGLMGMLNQRAKLLKCVLMSSCSPVSARSSWALLTHITCLCFCLWRLQLTLSMFVLWLLQVHEEEWTRQLPDVDHSFRAEGPNVCR